MDRQLPLLHEDREFLDSVTPRARKTDPETSHQAAKLLKLNERQIQALAVLKHHPGCTGQELADACGWPVWKRLKELEDQGRAKRGPSRKCRVTGSRAATWFAEGSQNDVSTEQAVP